MDFENEAKNPGGRPPHIPDETSRKTVMTMIAYGTPQEVIADVLDIDPKTLRKHYAKEIRTATESANAKVAESLFKKATDSSLNSASVTAAIFWMKTRAKWRTTDDEPPPEDADGFTIEVQLVEPNALPAPDNQDDAQETTEETD